MNQHLFDDDEEDIFGEPVYVDDTAKVRSGTKDPKVILSLLERIPTLRVVPTRNKIPIIKGWADPMFWIRVKSMRAQVEEWIKTYGEPGFAFALGPFCGPQGDLVIEADNESGEQWVREHVQATPIMTTTRHAGRPHRHYKPDILDAEVKVYRGNHVDVLGSRRAWERAAIEAGFQIRLQRGRESDEEHQMHVAQERERALKAIPMGPLVDIKCTGGQAMAPGSVHPTGHVYAEVEPWTMETWNARPTFDPKWFPDEIWIARERARQLAADERTAMHGRIDEDYWTPDRRRSAAQRYVDRVPAMRTGEGSSKTFMRLATVLIRGFALEIPDARALATHWARTICSAEPWREREIEHKLREAQARGEMEYGAFLRDRSTQPDARLEEAERAVERIRAQLGLSVGADFVTLDDVALPKDFIENDTPPPAPEDEEDLIALAAALIRAEEQAEANEHIAHEVAEPEPAPAPVEVSPAALALMTSDVFGEDELVPDQVTPGPSSSSPAPTSGATPGYTPPPGSEDSLRRLFASLGMDINEIRREGFTYQVKNDNEGNAIALEPSTVNLRLLFRFGRSFKGQFRLNRMGRIEEFAGVAIDDNQDIAFKLTADGLFGKEIPLERVKMAIIQTCSDNAYDPLQEFIDGLPAWDGVERWKQIPDKIFGVTKNAAFMSVIMEKFGLAAMARALRPGCKVDTTLVIQHENQGWFKSTFAKVLFGERFFTDQRIDTHDKDSRMLMAQHWCVELGEAELLSTPANVRTLKAFLSQARDDIRLPYGRRIVKFLRRNVFLATTNETQLLHDSTGDRRFWFLRPEKPADIALVTEWRNQLWAEAKEKVMGHFASKDIHSEEYKRGQWWLTADEQRLNDDNNLSRQYEDAWESSVYEFLGKQGRRMFLANDVLEHMQIAHERRDYVATRRVTEILRRVGCVMHNEGKPTRHQGRSGRFWEPPPVLPGEEQ